MTDISIDSSLHEISAIYPGKRANSASESPGDLSDGWLIVFRSFKLQTELPEQTFTPSSSVRLKTKFKRLGRCLPGSGIGEYPFYMTKSAAE